MSHSVKRAKSKNEQFRMAVPSDIRHLVGKTEWTESLGTPDPIAAAAKRGELIAFHKNEVLRLRGIVAYQPVQAALQLLDCGFDRLARIRGSVDAAITEQLSLLASTVIDSWAPAGQFGDIQPWGDTFVREPLSDEDPVPGIDSDPDREIFLLRASLLEGTGRTDGILYRRLAALLLERRTFKPIRFAVSYMTSIEPKLKLDRADVYEAVAEAYLRRLAGHVFTTWSANTELAWEPILSIPGTANLPASAPAPTPASQTAPSGPWAMPVSRGLEAWIAARAPSTSAITEARRGVSRFIALFGDMVLADITRAQVIEFRDYVADMPPRMTLVKIEASGRTLAEAVEAYRSVLKSWRESDGKEPEPEQLAPATVKKDVGSISQILGMAIDEAGSGTNVAEKIRIAGYSKKKGKQKKPRLSLTPAMMQNLFDSAVHWLRG